MPLSHPRLENSANSAARASAACAGVAPAFNALIALAQKDAKKVEHTTSRAPPGGIWVFMCRPAGPRPRYSEIAFRPSAGDAHSASKESGLPCPKAWSVGRIAL